MRTDGRTDMTKLTVAKNETYFILLEPFDISRKVFEKVKKSDLVPQKCV
jgi:hypothetical protein